MIVDDFYDDFYQQLMSGGSIGKAWGLIHRKMEKSFQNVDGFEILEIGAGNGEHIAFVKSGYQTYHATDIRKSNLDKIPEYSNVSKALQDAQKLDYPDNIFDRVIMTCVLAHLDRPEDSLAEMRRVSKNGATISLYLPCEPGMFLRFIRNLTTRRKAKKLSILNIEYLHYLEHRNYFIALNHFVEVKFDNDLVKRKYYPFPFLTWNWNLFALYEITVSKSSEEELS